MDDDDFEFSNCASSGKSRRKKKWSNEEVKKIVGYMRRNSNIEQPTAQIYYRKLIKATYLDADWAILRCKVRHLRQKFMKTYEWQKSSEAELLELSEGPGSVEKKIEKTCPFFNEMEEVFGPKGAIQGVGDINVKMEDFGDNIDVPDEDYNDHEEVDLMSEEEDIDSPTGQHSNSKFNLHSNINADRSVQNEIHNCNQSVCSKQNLEFEERKLKIETGIRRKQLLYNEKVLALEKRRFRRQIQVEDRKMVLQEKKLKLEEERLQMESKWRGEELELKRQELALMQSTEKS